MGKFGRASKVRISTVFHRIMQRYTDTGDVKDIPRSDRPVSVQTRRIRFVAESRGPCVSCPESIKFSEKL